MDDSDMLVCHESVSAASPDSGVTTSDDSGACDRVLRANLSPGDVLNSRANFDAYLAKESAASASLWETRFSGSSRRTLVTWMSEVRRNCSTIMFFVIIFFIQEVRNFFLTLCKITKRNFPPA